VNLGMFIAGRCTVGVGQGTFMSTLVVLVMPRNLPSLYLLTSLVTYVKSARPANEDHWRQLSSFVFVLAS
jgi:hypothetical protein